MKTLLNLAAVLTLALSTGIARADIDYENLLDESRDAARNAALLQQAAQNLPSDFPNRAGFILRSGELANGLRAAADALQGVVDGENPEWSAQQINRNMQLLQELRGHAVQWIESEARRIEGNYDGVFVDLAINLRRLADDVDDALRDMEGEIR